MLSNNFPSASQQQQQQVRPYSQQSVLFTPPTAAFMLSPPDMRQQNQHIMREKELQQKNLEKIQQHRLEREQQQRQQEDMRRKQEEMRRQQEEIRRQQQELEMRRRREAEVQAARKNAAAVAQSEVFHFQQISTLSTAGQSQQTYAVDRNFIRELEKNLGDNDSKFFLNLLLRSVAYPGCLSRIPDPGFYPSRIPDPKTATTEMGKKISCHTFFCSHKFHKIEFAIF